MSGAYQHCYAERNARRLISLCVEDASLGCEDTEAAALREALDDDSISRSISVVRALPLEVSNIVETGILHRS
jgi:hypothetical protein